MKISAEAGPETSSQRSAVSIQPWNFMG